MNPIAVNLAKQFEGYSEAPYKCPAGIWTAGWGHAFQASEPVRPLPPGEAETVLDGDLRKAQRGAFNICPVLRTENDKRQAAIIDFVFNLGSGRLKYSTLRRRINQQDWDEAIREIVKWVFAGGKKLPGLVLRRNAEANYLRGRN